VLLNAVVGSSVATVIALHAHIVLTPIMWVHGHAVGGALGSLRHLAVVLIVMIIGVTLESLALSRDAFARGEGAIATLLATVRRLVVEAASGALLVVQSPALRGTSRVDDDSDSGILRQLRSALSIAPTGPPARLAFGWDLWGPFGQSGHRAEVCAAA